MENKKRKSDEISSLSIPKLTPSIIRSVIDSLSKDELISLISTTAVNHPAVLNAVRTATGSDQTKRKLFVRGLAPTTTNSSLSATFSVYGEVEEAVAVVDKGSNKPRGFGFVIFKHVDSALLALQNPSKVIEGRMTVSQLAVMGNNASNGDVSARKVYVGNIPSEVSAERLLNLFMSYGEVEEGPLGFDNQTGKPKRFAFFIFKTEEGARASLVEPMKNIEGQQIVCKLAVDGKKGKDGEFATNPNFPNPNLGFGPMASQKPFLNSGPGFQPGSVTNPMYGNNNSYGGPGFGGYGGGSADFGGGLNGGGLPYGGLNNNLSEFGGGLNNNGGSMYRAPQNLGGIGSGGYPDGGNYGNQPPLGPPRFPPPGAMFPGGPPYY